MEKPRPPRDRPLGPQGPRLRGRGAASNETGRYEGLAREAVEDGWAPEEDPALLRTEWWAERPRSALNYIKSPDLHFDRSLNPYRGCEHGCIYCYARPSHAYLGLSPGLDFETRILARPGMEAVLRRELAKPGYKVAPVALGSNTDPYQPLESKLRVTRALVQLLHDCHHPLYLTTRGAGVERDLDLLAPMAARGLLQVSISVTTLNADLARKMEPRAPAPARRLAMIARLARAGIPVRVQVAPLIPGLTDHELEPIITAGVAAGARSAMALLLQLPGEVEGLFRAWAEAEVPDRVEKIFNRLKALHGGKSYASQFHTRMKGQGVWADLQAQRMARLRAALGIAAPFPPLRCDLFVPPVLKAAEAPRQLSLF